MKKFLTYGTTAVTLAVSLIAPVAALAQQGQLPPPPFTDPGGAISVLCRLAGWMFTFLIVLAIIFVLFAAFNYLTAGGDSEKVSKANQQLIYAAVAVAVGLFARGFPLLVSGFIAQGGGITGC